MRTSLGVAAVSCALLLSGCAGVNLTTNTTETGAVPGVALQGRVHGGQNPISGAKVYLYSVSTSGYGGASVSMLKNPVTTNSNGGFSISSDYTCSTGEQVYIYASGGTSGYGTNSAAGLLAGLGACSGLSSSTSIMVNEVSTIATAYALAGYATDATHISGSSHPLAATGIANAFLAITNMETLSTGVSLATTPAANGGNGTVPQAEINTLANILAACINSNGSTATGQPCGTLFSNALAGGTTGTQPTDTATAAINIAHNPGANVSTLFGLQGASPPFQTDLSAAPGDWTIAITFTGGGLSVPYQVAIDGSGNVWIADSPGYGEISEFSPVGAPISGSNGYTGGGLNEPWGILIDTSGNVWASNYNGSSLSEFNPSSGEFVNSTGFTGAGLNYPDAIVVDPSGHIWVSNDQGYSVSEFNSANGAALGTVTGGGLDFPQSVAVDAAGHLWVVDLDGYLSEFNTSNRTAVSAGGYTGCLNNPGGTAADASGNIWVTSATYTPDSGYVCEFSSAGVLSPNSPISGGGVSDPEGVAIDGSGNVWVTNGASGLSEFSSTGSPISPSNGYGYPAATADYIAIDGSGNIWLTRPVSNIKFMMEVVGVATPVVTPVVANLLSPYGAAAVNKP